MEPAEILTLGVAWYAVFLLAITCHEGAHAWAAKLGGDPTAFHAGQVTLSPLPHIRREPLGTVVVPILSYALGGWMIGWASAPYDPHWAERYPRRAAWMALAGPAANLALVLVAAAAIRVGVSLGIFIAPQTATFIRVVEATEPGTLGAVATLLSVLFVLNLLLFLFNLLPVPPLDGNAAITLLMSEEMGRRFRELTHSFGLLGLLLAWFLFGRIFEPLYTLALNLLHAGAGYG
ncbi:MAG TPA: site-2 protease family protein [Candidatus Acidoferrales bacterium]|nr:site-2 protease family protein [Candidatus Acidoferrales bacterium]